MNVNFIWEFMSETRKRYFLRLLGRILVFIACAVLAFVHPESYDILDGMNFFAGFSVLHLLWLIWVTDMLVQLLPIRHQVPLGSQKLFKFRFRPIREKINRDALKKYIAHTTRSAYKVMILWCALIAAIGAFYYAGILNDHSLFMITVLFYVCDLICVLIWCPFRLLMKTRCCTTCRIFNWDHLMMFTPMLYLDGFYPRSLLLISVAVWVLWEMCILIYPERFWEQTNTALRCSNCTDKLCTQYCRKLRPKEENHD
ncbi:MAG: hypothetical protein IJO98_04960 [Clostridia bacterium]|nr:hypothetical protein [Clostridia bacterium]